MGALKQVVGPAGLLGSMRDQRVVLGLFTATIFLSACLLFGVQPMFAKMVLPKLGGSPSVWAVSMCFFQAVLLGGYLYAHALNRRLGPEHAILTHLAILTVACLALPIALPEMADQPPEGNTYLWLVGVLALGVGLPFFAVSANAPLLQSWFGRTGHPHAADPYFLYGASNLGSLLALLSYPVLLEPFLGLAEQSFVWTVGYIFLAAGISVCGLTMIRAVRASAAVLEDVPTDAHVTDQSSNPPATLTWTSRAVWIALAFVPSGLLVAFTTFLTTDIASAPFLWVIPLAAFLGTFPMTFRDTPLIPHDKLVKHLPLFVGLTIVATASSTPVTWKLALISSAVAFGMITLVCHRELYMRRPPAAQLTEFYLWMSFGGVLGGMFAAILAPQLFTSVFEFPLLMAAALLLRPQILSGNNDKRHWRQAGLIALGAFVVLCLVNLTLGALGVELHPLARLAVCAAMLLVLLAISSFPVAQLGVVASMLFAVVMIPEGIGTLHQVRSFFGVHRVFEPPAKDRRMLFHGMTMHGYERVIDASGNRVEMPVPASYYAPQGPMAKGVEVARQATQQSRGDRPLRVGIVGLGAGSMACHKKTGESWRYFEIDQSVVDIARNEKLFRFLSACDPKADIVVGDARLTLIHEPAQGFDYLVIDAFSSDAIPTHLLTAEALQLYFDKLGENGLLAIHLSNRHLDLPPVVAAGLSKVPGVEAVLVRDIREKSTMEHSSSIVMLASRNPMALQEPAAWHGAGKPQTAGVKHWTDDYSDVLSTLLRKSFQ